jgi:hypothetical protein
VSGAPTVKFCGIKREKASMLRKTGKLPLLADRTYLTTFRNPTTREGSRSEPDQTTNNTRAETTLWLKNNIHNQMLSHSSAISSVWHTWGVLGGGGAWPSFDRPGVVISPYSVVQMYINTSTILQGAFIGHRRRSRED